MRRDYSNKPFLPNILVFCRARVMSPPGYHYAAGLVIIFCWVAFYPHGRRLGLTCVKRLRALGFILFVPYAFSEKRSVWFITSLFLHLGHAVSLTNNAYTVLRCKNNYILGTYTYVLQIVQYLEYNC